MDSVFLAVFGGVLVGALATVTYKLGWSNCENATCEKKKKALDATRRIRGRLANSDFVKRMHNRFKR